MTLLDRHIEFVEALRSAGLPVSLAEGLDAVEAITALDLSEREKEIVLGQVDGIREQLAGQVVETVHRMRGLELKKQPSIAETIDWARTLVALEIGTLDNATIDATLGVLLKHVSDHAKAVRELKLRS